MAPVFEDYLRNCMLLFFFYWQWAMIDIDGSNLVVVGFAPGKNEICYHIILKQPVDGYQREEMFFFSFKSPKNG